MDILPTHLSPPIVLSFAASDPTGGAGIQADLMAIAAMGCHPLSVLTALTVQDTQGVDCVLPLSAEWIERQARTLLEDMSVNAFKIGLLGSVEAAATIARIVADYPAVPVVFDPVLASGRGDALADAEMMRAMRQDLMPRTTVLTPNSLEARRLVACGAGEAEQCSLADCARQLISCGCAYVLLTGTHENTAQVVNALFDSKGLVRSDPCERLPGSYHGSGCTLASAVAAALARGLPVGEAVREAEEYTWQTLAAGFRPGRGQFIPDRFFRARKKGAAGNA